MAAKKVGILGDGNVGSALQRGLQKAGHETRAVGKDKGAIRETASWGEVIILAVPFAALDDVLASAGENVSGKVVVDATNALGPEMTLAVGHTSSGAEELQKKLPRARVVKAFNTVFAQNMDSGRVGDQRLTALVAGDDAAAKSTVLALAGDIGFEPVDAGPLRNARLLEPMALLNINLAYVQKLGTNMGFRIVRG